MKIKYSAEDRLKVRYTNRCADCGAVLDYEHVQVGYIFCGECWDKKAKELHQYPNLCDLCASCGIKKERWKGYGGCEAHVRDINSLMCKAQAIGRKIKKDLERAENGI